MISSIPPGEGRPVHAFDRLKNHPHLMSETVMDTWTGHCTCGHATDLSTRSVALRLIIEHLTPEGDHWSLVQVNTRALGRLREVNAMLEHGDGADVLLSEFVAETRRALAL
jgi:hypothetical protein